MTAELYPEVFNRLAAVSTPGAAIKTIMHIKKLDKASAVAWLKSNTTYPEELIVQAAMLAEGKAPQDLWADQTQIYSDTRWLRYALWLLGASQAMVGSATGGVNRATVNDSIAKCVPSSTVRQAKRYAVIREILGIKDPEQKIRATMSLEQLSEYVEAYKAYRAEGGRLPQDELEAVKLLIQLRASRARESDTSDAAPYEPQPAAPPADELTDTDRKAAMDALFLKKS